MIKVTLTKLHFSLSSFLVNFSLSSKLHNPIIVCNILVKLIEVHIMETFPAYVVATVETLKTEQGRYLTIRQKAEPFDFPLHFYDKRDIVILMTKFSKQNFYPGMAAPLIGILKRVIVFTVPKHGTTENCQKNVWLNPSYEAVNDKMIEDYECCVSVKSVIGPVKRYETIHYKAYDIKGNLCEGEAHGLTARVIQHETDHLDGKLFIDLVSEDKLMSIREYVTKIKCEHTTTPE